MEKELYWLVESNGDLSNTVQTLEHVKDLIEGDFDNEEQKQDVQYTITPKYLTQKEYEALPED